MVTLKEDQSGAEALRTDASILKVKKNCNKEVKWQLTFKCKVCAPVLYKYEGSHVPPPPTRGWWWGGRALRKMEEGKLPSRCM